MRRRACFISSLVLVATAWAAAPSLAGGGGQPGVCIEEPRSLSDYGVTVADSCFFPNTLTIPTGQTVRWEAVGEPGGHTVTFPEGPDSGPLFATFTVQFNQPGTYAYVCTYHAGMAGTVKAEGVAQPGSTFDVLGESGQLLTSYRTSTAPASSNETMVVRFDPLAAAIIVLLGLPLSTTATLRLAGLGRKNKDSRIQLQLPWRSEARPSTRR